MDDLELDARLNELAQQRRFERTMPQIQAEMERRQKARRRPLVARLRRWLGGENRGGEKIPKHFLEGFLEALGRVLHLPWWAANAALYVLAWVGSAVIIDLRILFPFGGMASAAVCAVVEFTIGTWMLYRVRQARADTFRFATAIESADDRARWFAKYLGPFHEGWTVPLSGVCFFRGETVARLRPWFLTTALVVLFYVSLSLDALRPASTWGPKWFVPSLIWLYPNMLKPVVFLWVVAYLGWLSGLMQLARGRHATGSSEEGDRLAAHCRARAIGLNLTITIPTCVWLFVNRLACGMTLWTWLFSLALVAMSILEAIIIERPKLSQSKPFQAVKLSFTHFLTSEGRGRWVPKPAILSIAALPVASDLLGWLARRLLFG